VSFANGLHSSDPAFGGLVLSICACASIYAYRQYPRGDARSSGWAWFNQIPFEKFVFSDALSLHHLQLYCVRSVSIFLFGIQLTFDALQLTIFYLGQIEIAGHPDLNWLLVGICIRLAQSKGIHRRSEDDSESIFDDELWKRAFWFLITSDMSLSEFYGRPRATSSQE
jgi:hypothetical protein